MHHRERVANGLCEHHQILLVLVDSELPTPAIGELSLEAPRRRLPLGLRGLPDDQDIASSDCASAFSAASRKSRKRPRPSVPPRFIHEYRLAFVMPAASAAVS